MRKEGPGGNTFQEQLANVYLYFGTHLSQLSLFMIPCLSEAERSVCLSGDCKAPCLSDIIRLHLNNLLLDGGFQRDGAPAVAGSVFHSLTLPLAESRC